MLEKYVKKIVKVSGSRDAREESFYSAIENLFSDYAESIKKKNIHITTLPKKTEAGNPDFRIWDGKVHIVGYIEAKKIGTNLNDIERTEQLQRYLSTFANLILTNYSEFRLYRNGKLTDKVEIFRAYVVEDLKRKPPIENKEQFNTLMEKFFSFSVPKVSTAKSLATELASKTRYMRDVVVKKALYAKENNNIRGFYHAFEKYLIAGLTEEGFADLYSQTLTYGLFAARTRAESTFIRKNAYEYIPHTIGILKEVFKFISLDEIPKELEWIIDDIVEILSVSNVNKILSDFYKKGKGKDPIVHFYETFLSEYDPQMREKRGVYYTPEPVVKFIVRSVHQILKDNFNKPDGLADKNVTVLDPAAGTMTFIAEAMKLATDEYVEKYGTGGKKSFLKDNILKNFYAFELLMAPYAIGHLKMSFLFEELGYKLKDDDRVKLYLTNTLDMKEHDPYDMPGIGKPLSIEANEANEIKKNKPILVIIGNPPYSGISSNQGKWITDLIETYKYVDGKHFNERKHWLNDDYVKFIRFSQWKIDQNGEGILGFITNHAYLDNPTFRGMRQSLMKTFDEMYILDLHGNSLKKETCPDGSKDENVFDIRAGVAIVLFIKNKTKKSMINHYDIYGKRNEKYKQLESSTYKSIKYKTLTNSEPFYFFINVDETNKEEYYSHHSVNQIFPLNVTGIVTARDKFVIDSNLIKLQNRINQFINNGLTDEQIRNMYRLKDSRGWKLEDERINIRKLNNIKKYFTKILYRPFDIRNIFYSNHMVDWGRENIMKHMLEDNVGLIISRQMDKSGSEPVFVTEDIIDAHSITSATSISYLHPLYIYPDKNKYDLFSHISDKKEPNIDEKIYKELNEKYKRNLTPEEILAYVYGVLYSNDYREKYNQFLKSDFPRIPFVEKYKDFKKTAQKGQELIDLHLMKSDKLNKPASKFNGEGDCKIDKLKYDKKSKRLFINKTQYFDNITDEMFNYYIGGYQVLHKWLKDRKGNSLSSEDIQHYCRVVTVIKETVGII